MFTLTATTSSPNSDPLRRTADFALLPVVSQSPIISSHPATNITQTTWIEAVRGGKIRYQRSFPLDGVFKAVSGTEIAWSLFATDPSDQLEQRPFVNLSYFWRKDGSPLTSINNTFNFNGVRSILITSESCTPLAGGTYVCEVSNQFGVTETKPLNLQIIDLKTHPLLYSNLILNGNADSLTDGWTIDGDIISLRFFEDAAKLNNFGSIPQASIWYRFERDVWDVNSPEQARVAEPQEFRFSQGSWNTTFPSIFDKWKQNASNLGLDYLTYTPGWISSVERGSGSELLADGDQWILFKHRPQIVANEDRGQFNGFFPGMKWIDSYNSNSSEAGIGLFAESENQVLNYFTRDKLRLNKYGGTRSSTMKQTIDLVEVADFIDGNVFGVRYLSAQFFAYVGAGISRYKIRLPRLIRGNKQPEVLNWYILDSEKFYEHVSKISGNPAKRVLAEGEAIEIEPLLEDITTIELRYLDSVGNLVGTKDIKTPDIQDVWAIKEKVFFPLTLYPIFEFFINTTKNPIKVFGQTYTTMESLKPLFDANTPYPFSSTGGSTVTDLDPNEYGGIGSDLVSDRNAKFMMERFGFIKFDGLFPNWFDAGPDDIAGVKLNRRRRALADFGAAAMFGVEDTSVIPKGTRSIEVVVTFTHTSEVLFDDNPINKGWDSELMYYDNFGQEAGNSLRFCEYGYPRCGLTKTKLVLIPNNFEPDESFISYKLPPTENTVLGVQKSLMVTNVVNTSLSGSFNYVDVIADQDFILPEFVAVDSPFLSVELANQLATQQIQQQFPQQIVNTAIEVEADFQLDAHHIEVQDDEEVR